MIQSRVKLPLINLLLYINAIVRMRGTISFNNAIILPIADGSKLAKPVMLPPGCASDDTKPAGQRVVNADKYDRNGLGLAADRINSRTSAGIDDVWLECDDLLCSRLQCRGPISLVACITALNLNGFSLTPSKLH